MLYLRLLNFSLRQTTLSHILYILYLFRQNPVLPPTAFEIARSCRIAYVHCKKDRIKEATLRFGRRNQMSSSNILSIHGTKYVHIKSTTVYAPRRNWDSPNHMARIPSPLPLHVAKTGRNHLNEKFTPLLPTGIGERF